MFEHAYNWAVPPVRMIKGGVEILIGWRLPPEYRREQLLMDDYSDDVLGDIAESGSSAVEVKYGLYFADMAEIMENIKELDVREYCNQLNRPENYVWASPSFLNDKIINPNGTGSRRGAHEQMNFTSHSGEDLGANCGILYTVYLHPYWDDLPRYTEEMSDRSPPEMVKPFERLYCKAMHRVFGAHPERDDAFAMVCRLKQNLCPRWTCLLYILDTTEQWNNGCRCSGTFEDRMRLYERRLQQESHTGSDQFVERLLQMTDADYEAALEEEILWLDDEETLPNCKFIRRPCGLHKYLDEINKAPCDDDEDVEMLEADAAQTKMSARILELCMQSDKCLSSLTSAEIRLALKVLLSQMENEVDTHNDPKAKLAARVIEMHMRADSCLSVLSEKDKLAMLRLLLRGYGKVSI